MPPALRVLIVEPEGTSGNWHYAVMLGLALRREGIDVVLGTLFPYHEVSGAEQLPIAPIGRRPAPIAWHRRLSADRAVYHVEKIRRVCALVHRLKPDIVHVQLPLGALDFAYFAYLRAMGSRVVFTAFQPRLGLSPLAFFERARYRQADAILVHAASTVRQLVAAGIDAGKIRRIPHGNFLDLCTPRDLPQDRARQLLGVPTDARVVLFFGAIEPRKGLDLLIDAVALMAADDKKICLVIAGYPVENFTGYAEQIAQRGLTSRVVLALRWIPFSEMQQFFKAADVVALPYRWISQSGVIQLAYAYSRPVVVTNVGGIAEAVREDGTGLVTSGIDSTAFARALRTLLADPARAEQMGRRGTKLAETKYSWTVVAGQIARLYKDLVQGEVRMAALRGH